MINQSITTFKDRPGIIITDMSQSVSAGSAKLADLISREEINTVTTSDPISLLRTQRGAWQLVVIRDGGLQKPCFELIESIRSFSDIPVMTVSDSCCEIYIIMALSKGADFCFDAQDFGAFEFKARLVSMLRRYLADREPAAAPVSVTSDTIRNGSLTVNRRLREVYSGKNKIRLTAIEYGIIEYLMENCGDVCTVEDIYRRVWQETPYSVRKTVVEHIRRIRCKIEPDPHNPQYIKAVFGKGYKMEKAV